MFCCRLTCHDTRSTTVPQGGRGVVTLPPSRGGGGVPWTSNSAPYMKNMLCDGDGSLHEGFHNTPRKWTNQMEYGLVQTCLKSRCHKQSRFLNMMSVCRLFQMSWSSAVFFLRTAGVTCWRSDCTGGDFCYGDFGKTDHVIQLVPVFSSYWVCLWGCPACSYKDNFYIQRETLLRTRCFESSIHSLKWWNWEAEKTQIKDKCTMRFINSSDAGHETSSWQTEASPVTFAADGLHLRLLFPECIQVDLHWEILSVVFTRTSWLWLYQCWANETDWTASPS